MRTVIGAYQKSGDLRSDSQADRDTLATRPTPRTDSQSALNGNGPPCLLHRSNPHAPTVRLTSATSTSARFCAAFSVQASRRYPARSHIQVTWTRSSLWICIGAVWPPHLPWSTPAIAPHVNGFAGPDHRVAGPANRVTRPGTAR